MDNKNFEEFLKRNRPLAPKISLEGKRLWGSVEREYENRAGTKTIMSLALAASLVVWFFVLSPLSAPSEKELEAVAAVEEIFEISLENELPAGEGFLALSGQ